MVLGCSLSSSATTFDLNTRLSATSCAFVIPICAASTVDLEAMSVVESSCAVSLRFSRSVISVTRMWPHVSSARPTTKINQPTWSNLCAHLGICGSGSSFQINDGRFLCNQERVQINASAPSIITPTMTNTNPSSESADQRFSDEASAALIQKVCRMQRIVGYGTLTAILLSMCFHACLAAYRKTRK